MSQLPHALAVCFLWAFVEPVKWPFVVIEFMRSIMGFRCPAPMNRGTTNGLGEGLLFPFRKLNSETELHSPTRLAWVDRRTPASSSLRHTGANASHLPPFHGGDLSEAVASQRPTSRLHDVDLGWHTIISPCREVNLGG